MQTSPGTGWRDQRGDQQVNDQSNDDNDERTQRKTLNKVEGGAKLYKRFPYSGSYSFFIYVNFSLVSDFQFKIIVYHDHRNA